MPTAGCMRFNAAGRVIVALAGPVVAFNGGTPVNASGAVVIEDAPPDAYLGGFGFRLNDAICARQGLGSGEQPGGLARTSIGALAIALTEPITGYVAGMPIVADGRLAVAFDGPAPTDAFTEGFSGGFS